MSTYSAAVLATSGLVSYWRLGESAGTTATDSKGTNHGTYLNTPALGATGLLAGDPDTAVQFVAASSQELTLPNPTFSTNGSFEFWFKWTAGTALVRDHSTAPNSWIIGFDSAGTFAVRAGSGTVNTSKTTAQVRDGARHHLVLSVASSNFTVYLDGVSIATGTIGATAQIMPWHVSENGANAQYSDATFDEVAIYSVGLSGATVSNHYTLGITVPPAPPTVSTDSATSISATGATLNGTVNPNGKSTTAQFEWGTTTGYGTTVSLGTIGSDSIGHALSTILSGLTTGTTYHYRITATNSDGTTNGSDVTFVPAQAAFREPDPRAGLWDFDICDGSGNKLGSLIRHQGTSLTFTRNGVPDCQFSLSHDDDECATILTALKDGTGRGMPTLKGYRIGRDGTKTLRFNGYLASISEESGTEASSATFTFRGPFGRYLGDGDNRGVFINSSGVSYTGTDAGVIARSIINGSECLGETPSNVPIGPGTLVNTKTRDRTYPPFTNVGEAIVNLTNVLDGFDFEVGPNTNPGAATPLFMLDIYASMGSDKSGVKFEYGPNTLANCSAMHRQTVPPVNDVIVVGSGGIYAEASDNASIAKYGEWLVVVQMTDVSEQATLNDKANALLRPNPVKTLDFTPDPRLAPSPWDDYWIGDTVRFYANRGALVEGPLSVRVNQIRVVIDPDTGLEAAEIPDPLTDDDERVIQASLQTEVVI